MATTSRHEQNQAAFRALKSSIDKQFTRGRFVAIHDGQVIANADQIKHLIKEIQSLGKEPRDTLVVQAGVEYPEGAVVLPLN